MFESLNDEKLITAYEKAVKLDLEQDFIELLELEIANRGLLKTN